MGSLLAFDQQAQVVGAQERDGSENGIHYRQERGRYAPSDERCQRDPPQMDLKTREERTDFASAYTPHVRIVRVIICEIIPENCSLHCTSLSRFVASFQNSILM
jgi:hypothetical protein